MRQWIRSHLTYANVMATLAVFIALAGTATAAVIITDNSQVAQGTISGHKPPTGKHANIIANSINGQDIADRSGVDTCKTPLTVKLGSICAGSDGANRDWFSASNYCNNFDLRLPTMSEALYMARNFDVPGVAADHDYFWTDEWHVTGTDEVAATVSDDSQFLEDSTSDGNRTVCVTDPSA
jgi:hypothetical protein